MYKVNQQTLKGRARRVIMQSKINEVIWQLQLLNENLCSLNRGLSVIDGATTEPDKTTKVNNETCLPILTNIELILSEAIKANDRLRMIKERLDRATA